MATTDNRVPLTENDTADKIRFVLQGHDITGWSFWLKVGYRRRPLVKLADIEDGPNGVASFSFAYGELKPGTFEGEILTQDPAGLQKTLKGFRLDIARRIKGSP